jgi:hypothetical protein
LKLVEEEARQIDRVIPSNQECNSNSALVTKSGRAKTKKDTQKPNLKCYNCGKMGHKSRVCWSKPKNDGKNKNNENDAMTIVACNTELTNSGKTWYLDSGATRHMCRDRTNEVKSTRNKSDKVKKTYCAYPIFKKISCLCLVSPTMGTRLRSEKTEPQ